MTPEPLLTARQVATFLGISPATALDWWEAGRLPGFKLPTGAVRFRVSEIEAWLDACRRGPNAAAKAQRSVHFSSRTPEWETPQALFDELDREFDFELDVCATPENAKCARFYTRAEDGLAQPWRGTCWMNPPYGRHIGTWMRKATEAASAGATVVCLVPARTDTSWWHEYAERGEIRFLRGRLRFGGSENSAPFPSAVVVFRGR